MATSSGASLRAAALIPGWLAFLFSAPGFAGAAWLNETGGADMGMASAGRAAFATDATTIGANPAGMATLAGYSVTAVVLPVKADMQFAGQAGAQGRASNQADSLPIVSAYASARQGHWALGFGAYTNVGLGCDFGEEWVGRRAIEQAELGSINLVPAVAYAVTDRLSIGASAGAQYATAYGSLAVANDAAFYGPPAGLADGQIELEGDSWAGIANLGVVYRAAGGTRVGLAWTSAVDHAIDLDVHAHGLHPTLGAMLQQQGALRADVYMPQQLMLSVARPLSATTLLAASAGWQQWSAFGATKIQWANGSASMFPDGLQDTWSAAVGLRQRLDPRWTLAAGVAYDSDPSTRGRVPVYFPVAEQFRVAAGADYRYSDALLLRFSASVINQGEIHVAQDSFPLPLPGIPPVDGTIRNSRIYVLGLTADYRP